jgi:hypothetical protein
MDSTRTTISTAIEEDPPRSAWYWAPRAAIVLWLGWAFLQSIGESHRATLFSGIDLGIHEAGHIVFAPFGRFLGIAGGTILQLLAPVLAAIVFWRQGDRVGICFAAAWLGINLVEVSVYVADARAQALPLVTVGGGEPLHDWHYLLGRMGLLRHDRGIATAIRVLGWALHAGAVAAGAWFVTGMASDRTRAR